MERGGSGAESGDELEELDIWFPGLDGEPIDVPSPLSTEEVLRRANRPVAAALDQLKDLRATPGFRPGGSGDRPERLGVLDEVMTPVLIRPSVTKTLAASGALFTPPVPRMTVDDRSLEVSQRGLAWQVTVRTGLLARRQATLRIEASPSANLTVLELIPNKRRPLWRRAFVRAGIEVMIELSSRLRTRSMLSRRSPRRATDVVPPAAPTARGSPES